MRNTKRTFAIVILAAFGFICIGLASCSFIFKNDDNNEIKGDDKNAAFASIHTVTYDKQNASSITSLSAKCLDYGRGCTVTTPNISVENGYVVIGWSKNKDGKGGIFKVNEQIEITENTTLYAIVKENSNNTDNLKNFNIDNYCNETIKCKVGIDVVDVACSQVGYVEKATDENLSDCTANKGDNNYQKFGNNGNVWDATFINWVFNVTKVSLKDKGISDVDDVSEYINWAKNNNRWYTDKSSLHNGDLVIIDQNQHIGIAVSVNNEWNIIIGNSNNKVELINLDRVSGFINMKSIAY